MKGKLSSGISLVVDRYAFSGVAYTSAKVLCSASGYLSISIYFGNLHTIIISQITDFIRKFTEGAILYHTIPYPAGY